MRSLVSSLTSSPSLALSQLDGARSLSLCAALVRRNSRYCRPVCFLHATSALVRCGNASVISMRRATLRITTRNPSWATSRFQCHNRRNDKRESVINHTDHSPVLCALWRIDLFRRLFLRSVSNRRFGIELEPSGDRKIEAPLRRWMDLQRAVKARVPPSWPFRPGFSCSRLDSLSLAFASLAFA
jgi:hypothetical protein